MEVEHLDHEIERLNLLNRTQDLSAYGQGILIEFKQIKEELTKLKAENEGLLKLSDYNRKMFNKEQLNTVRLDMKVRKLEGILCKIRDTTGKENTQLKEKLKEYRKQELQNRLSKGA